jgi:hypothetical protein
LLVRSFAAAQFFAIFFTLLVGVPLVSYGGWYWHRHADWVEASAVVDHCEYRRTGADSVEWVAQYRFKTLGGQPVKAFGTWGEDVLTRPGEIRTVLYNPARPRELTRSKTGKLKLFLWISLFVYVGVTLFYGLFAWQEERRRLRLERNSDVDPQAIGEPGFIVFAGLIPAIVSTLWARLKKGSPSSDGSADYGSLVFPPASLDAPFEQGPAIPRPTKRSLAEWAVPEGDAWRTLLHAVGLDALTELIAVGVRPAVRMEPRTSEVPSRHESHMGGSPWVSFGFEWPVVKGQPMLFLAQLRLDELAPTWTTGLLPKYGDLLFFVDHLEAPDDDGDDDNYHGHVLLIEEGNRHQMERPVPSSAKGCALEPSSLSFVPFADIPYEVTLAPAAARLPRNAEGLYSDVRQYLGRGQHPMAHVLLGHEREYAMGLEDRADAAAMKAIAGRPDGPEQDLAYGKFVDEYLESRQVLASFSLPPARGAVVPSRLTYWIRTSDLRQARFDRVLVDAAW